MSAGIAATERDGDTAREHLDNAEKLLGPAPQPVDRAMLSIGKARIAVLDGNGDAAIERARAAIDILGTTQPAEQGAAVWALAQGFALQRNVESATDAYGRAVDLLSVHGQRFHAGTAALEWAGLLQEHGREEEAEPVLRRAYDLGVGAETEARTS